MTTYSGGSYKCVQSNDTIFTSCGEGTSTSCHEFNVYNASSAEFGIDTLRIPQELVYKCTDDESANATLLQAYANAYAGAFQLDNATAFSQIGDDLTCKCDMTCFITTRSVA